MTTARESGGGNPPEIPPGIPKRPKTAGVILAGGRSRRMGGGDKCLQPLGGEYLISHVITRARSQVDALAINANGDPGRFADFGLPVIQDGVEGFAGPLAGVLAGLDWAAEAAPSSVWLATFACDAPFFPLNLVTRLWAETETAGGAGRLSRSGQPLGAGRSLLQRQPAGGFGGGRADSVAVRPVDVSDWRSFVSLCHAISARPR